ncbi:hypothetical protein LXT12_25940 [Pelomonas sp. P7]|uniref:Uncharacterized protein n=1 Tax=Pelomonas caseinilytica TaxID=2906763 RepID=A0ABS8XII9_9BURK|nr:hypothetical protein [Pelomonas sp. P7]MCE4540679.1 hypothetical protein [Pelomonas sp. P7]
MRRNVAHEDPRLVLIAVALAESGTDGGLDLLVRRVAVLHSRLSQWDMGAASGGTMKL